MRFFIFFLISSLLIVKALAQELPLNRLKLPAGFSIEIYAKEINNARQMALGSKDIVFVGSMFAGNVYAIAPTPQGRKVFILASGLKMPNGVAFRNGSLYVAETHRILRYDNIEQHLDHPPKPVVIRKDLPTKEDHGWRYIAFGPDDKLYIAIGSPCNVCVTNDPRLGTIARMDPDGSHFEIMAKGLRNSVGFDWEPSNKKLWFTDNGRDLLGDHIPPDELNLLSENNLDFGFPYCHGGIPDPVFGKVQPCSKFTPPMLALPAHVAALGIKFYKAKMFPEPYREQMFIAEHGSWNSSTKVGYQIVTVSLDHHKVSELKPFITGWLENKEAWGRPVDLLTMPDGAMLISDDFANVVYRVSYKGKE